jgi:hypothetical protein
MSGTASGPVVLTVVALVVAAAAAGPALTTAVQRLELQTPPADALFGTDTSGLAENDILYSGRAVLLSR